MLCKRLSAAAFVASFAFTVHGATHYVRAQAGGDGSGGDWSNAFSSLPSTLVPGDTYYVADGTYPPLTVKRASSGTAVITIKKATTSDHGTGTGWQSSYGDGKATFESVSFAADNVVFDGVRGSGTGGYGFEVYSTAPADTNFHLVRIEAGVEDLTIRHVDIHRPSRDYKGRGINATSYGNARITVSNCYLHDLFGVHFYFIEADRVTIERCVMARNKSTAEWHSESIQARATTNLVVKYCWFEDIQGTAVIISGSGNSSNWDVFGNVFYATSGFSQENGHGTIADNQKDSIHHVRVYNNTFVGIKGFKCGVRFWKSTGNCTAYNNLFYDCRGVGYQGTVHDYNSYYDCEIKDFEYERGPHDDISSGNPLVNPGGRDMHLRAATAPGRTDLGSLYSVDPDGNRRGADGAWDRGAYEKTGSSPPPPPPQPDPPRNVRIRP